MTQEDKLLLLKDLSARLIYGVIVDYKEGEYDFHHWKISTLHSPAYSQSGSLINTDSDGWIEYEEYKGCGMSTGSRPLHLGRVLPYLRPMSSMTEEEKEELERLINEKLNKHIGQEDDEWTPWVLYDTTGIKNYVGGERFYFDEMSFIYDWLNAHHFDYRGLIEKGLALEAPEIMYKHFGDMDVVVTSVEHKDKL